MTGRISRAMGPIAGFGMGVIVATSVGVAVAGTHGAHPAVAKQVKVKPVLVRSSVMVGAGVTGSQYADCPKGDVAISGGAGWQGDAGANQFIAASGPVNHTDVFDTTTSHTKPLDWYATFYNKTPDNHKAYVWVECLPSK